jgi:AcrR family transcriptional regulator
MTNTPPYARARTPEKKQERAHDLLNAAAELARDRGVRAVTLTAVADRAGLHHSAMRRYFSSHKEVLLRLAGSGWERWADAVAQDLSSRKSATADTVVDVVVRTLSGDQLLCDLLGNVVLRLEPDAGIEAVREYKRVSVAAYDRMVDALAEALPALGQSGARDFVSAVTALAATLWQVANPDEKLAKVYGQEPGLAHLMLDFEPTLRRLARATLAGLLNGTAG